jgi:hypothetical protein
MNTARQKNQAHIWVPKTSMTEKGRIFWYRKCEKNLKLYLEGGKEKKVLMAHTSLFLNRRLIMAIKVEENC